MTGLVYVLSPPEAVEQFRDIVRAVLEQGSQFTPELQRRLNERAEELDVHPVDRDRVLQEVMALPEVRRAIDRKRFAKSGEQDTGIGQTAALQIPRAEPVVVNPPPWKQRWDPFRRLSHQLACTLFFAPLFVLFLGLGLGLVIDHGDFLYSILSFILMGSLFLTWATRSFALRGSFRADLALVFETITGVAAGVVLMMAITVALESNVVFLFDMAIASTTSLMAMGIGIFASQEISGVHDYDEVDDYWFLFALGIGSWLVVLMLLEAKGMFAAIEASLGKLTSLLLIPLLWVVSLVMMVIIIWLVPSIVAGILSEIYCCKRRGPGLAFLLSVLIWSLLAFVSLGGLTFLQSGSWPLPYWPFGSGG